MHVKVDLRKVELKGKKIISTELVLGNPCFMLLDCNLIFLYIKMVLVGIYSWKEASWPAALCGFLKAHSHVVPSWSSKVYFRVK